MKFDADDGTVLKTAAISSLLDLALAFPKSFDDLTISTEPSEGENTVLICPLSKQRRNGGILQISAFCISWDCDIKITIFNAKGWHYGAFKDNVEIYINGRANFAFSSWQFVNPKIITKVGQIVARYKSVIKDSCMQKYIKKYINKEALLGEGLDEKEANLLLGLHEISHENALNLGKIGENSELVRTLKFVEIFNYMKKLSSKRIFFPSMRIETFEINEWLQNLPFKPTDDQILAINDIREDFAKNFASKRVVMGDVGSGKTLVILACALMVYPRCAILMAPTSILAEQIYDEATRLLPNFMRVMLLKSGEKNVEFDGVNFIISTHALLYQKLPCAPLVMVDEQHRFGSNQREMVNVLASRGNEHAHFIQFSATPIPRTLSLIESELVSFSFLKQMPMPKKISTILVQNSGFGDMLKHIKKELDKNNQVAIIYPLVEKSDISSYQSLTQAAPFWLENFQKVYITHGKDSAKDEVLREFRDSGGLLLTTTVVEVGISLPRLCIIVIVGAERLGLATLHQLRGRVGRNGGEGWCYLYTKLKIPPPRLDEFARTIDGFKVAQLDLINRQAGDIMGGRTQHGATFTYYEFEEDITLCAKNRLASLRAKNF